MLTIKIETKTYKSPKSTNITSSKNLEELANLALSTEVWMASTKNKLPSKSSTKGPPKIKHLSTKKN